MSTSAAKVIPLPEGPALKARMSRDDWVMRGYMIVHCHLPDRCAGVAIVRHVVEGIRDQPL